MNFGKAIDAFVRDWRLGARINSDGTERSYRKTLYLHLDDCDDADPRETTREDVKETLLRWDQPNTIKARLAAMVSFYDWMGQEGYRTDNPAKQVRRPKARQANVYRLTRGESAAILVAARGKYEQRITTLGICEGLRNAEMRGMRGRHFARPGFVHVPADVGKGGRERWVPVILEALAMVEEIRAMVGDDEFVLPRQVPVGGALQVAQAGAPVFKEDCSRPCSQQHIGRIVARVAQRAGIREHIYPHLLRHAYADHVSRHAGVKVAQHVLGHANIATTQLYLDRPTPDELADAVYGMEFGPVLAGASGSHAPVTRPAGFEPAMPDGWHLGREAENLFDRARLAGQVLLYERWFRGVSGEICPPDRPGTFRLRDQT